MRGREGRQMSVTFFAQPVKRDFFVSCNHRPAQRVRLKKKCLGAHGNNPDIASPSILREDPPIYSSGCATCPPISPVVLLCSSLVPSRLANLYVLGLTSRVGRYIPGRPVSMTKLVSARSPIEVSSGGTTDSPRRSWRPRLRIP